MAPKQDPKPKFQEGIDLFVLISGCSVVSVSAAAAGNVSNASQHNERNNTGAAKQLAMLAFIVVHKRGLDLCIDHFSYIFVD